MAGKYADLARVPCLLTAGSPTSIPVIAFHGIEM